MPKGVFWKISTNFFDNPTERKTERHDEQEVESTEVTATKRSHYIQAGEMAALLNWHPAITWPSNKEAEPTLKLGYKQPS